MKNKALIFFVALILSSALGSCQSPDKNVLNTPKVTPQMVEEQEAKCLETHLITKIKESNHELDTLSVKEIKTLFANKLKTLRKDRDNLISRNQDALDREDAYFDSLKKYYSTDYEIFIDNHNILNKLVNNNHLNYRDTIQNGVYFNQKFENNKTYIKPVVRNNGASVFKFRNEETIRPFYPLNFDSEEDVQITEIYYYNSREKNLPTDDIYFPLNPIQIPQLKHVDSVAMSFKVKFLSKVDTLHFTKADIGVQKGKIKLLKMEDNYVEYELPYDYYPYHKGTLLEEAFYNKQGQLLDSELTLSNTGHENAKDFYNITLANTKTIVSTIKDLKTREDIYLTLRYLALKEANIYLRSRAINRHLLKGNVSSFTLYLENTRDTISFSTVLKNKVPVRNLYVHKFDKKTDFIDKDGKLISSFPHEINFVKSSRGDTYSDSYFFISDSYPNYEYYFLDHTNGRYTPLPYSQIDYLCPSLLFGKLKDKTDIELISTSENKVLLT